MKRQQKTAETEEGTVQIQEGAVATGEDSTSVAIASIQSAATFPDPNVNDDAVGKEGTVAETHYTYFPSTAVGDGSGSTTSGSTTTVVTTQGSEALLGLPVLVSSLCEGGGVVVVVR
ncbi:upstream stimulatory factor 1 isoform X1, partial [Sigmodon hispidus]